MLPLIGINRATHRDFIWMSPEVLSLLKQVEVHDFFQEHSTVIAGLSLPDLSVPKYIWPQPGSIPWEEVDVDAWHHEGVHSPVPPGTPTQWYARFSRSVERSLQGYVTGAPGLALPSKCFGRGQRTEPDFQQCPALPKASRPGEEALRHDGVSREVIRWFKQLRRLQSYLHSARSRAVSATSAEYRISLWNSIRRAPGFKGGFAEWWRHRGVKLVGAPADLPWYVPHADMAELIFQDFRANFRKLEHWHIGQRIQALKQKYDQTHKQLFQELRQESPPQVDTLTLHHTHAILAVEPSTGSVQLESAPDTRGHSTWSLEGVSVRPVPSSDEPSTFFLEVPVLSGQELEQEQTLHDTAQIQSEFVFFGLQDGSSISTPGRMRGQGC